jgi:hypothetical protein
MVSTGNAPSAGTSGIRLSPQGAIKEEAAPDFGTALVVKSPLWGSPTPQRMNPERLSRRTNASKLVTLRLILFWTGNDRDQPSSPLSMATTGNAVQPLCPYIIADTRANETRPDEERHLAFPPVPSGSFVRAIRKSDNGKRSRSLIDGPLGSTLGKSGFPVRSCPDLSTGCFHFSAGRIIAHKSYRIKEGSARLLIELTAMD